MTALSMSYDGKIPLAPTCFVSMILALIAEACGTCISGMIEGRTSIAAMPRSMCNAADANADDRSNERSAKTTISLIAESPWLEVQ